jgi:hypothetical protein
VFRSQFSLAFSLVSGLDAAYEERLTLVGEELARLVKRLRSLSPAAWRVRQSAVVAALHRLAELSALAEGVPARPVPAVADHVLPDAVAVIAGDALASLAERRDEDLVAAVLVTLRVALDDTR